MWEFADRLLTSPCLASGTSAARRLGAADGNGNYTFGLNEQVMFHDQDRIDRVRGMDITFVTTATNDDEGRALLRHLGFPFRAN
jgi:large subunit ribosomal protein L5